MTNEHKHTEANTLAAPSVGSGDLFGIWQPIETAPKDQWVPILATDGNLIEICHYEGDMMIKWRFGDQGHDAMEATHWMPLPSLPNKADTPK